MDLLPKKLIDLLNYRIEQEEYSSRLYKRMSICMGYHGYLGAEKLFKKYSEEEATHAEWAYKYLLSLDINPTVPALKAPEPDTFPCLKDVLIAAFKHEVEITNQCEKLAKAAMEEGSFMTLALAQKYLNEQVEEIEKTTTLCDILESLTEEDGSISRESLKLLDNQINEMV
jgi:ferritin